MRLGARWQVGDAPHASVPSALHAVIAEREAANPTATSWTLTWLEGRPRCELDTGESVELNAAGEIQVVQRAVGDEGRIDGIVDSEDDDWLG